MFKSANNAYDLGFQPKVKQDRILMGIYDLALLDQVLSENGLQNVEAAVTTAGGGNNTITTNALPDVVS